MRRYGLVINEKKKRKKKIEARKAGTIEHIKRGLSAEFEVQL